MRGGKTNEESLEDGDHILMVLVFARCNRDATSCGLTLDGGLLELDTPEDRFDGNTGQPICPGDLCKI